MAEIGNVNNRLPPAPGTAADGRALDVGAVGNETRRVTTQPGAPTNASVGQPGALGQPTGLPVAGAGAQVLPDVLAGRDPSQMAAAERMRQAGGASAVEALLGLDRQPSIVGALTAPPGNLEALRHMTPVMRRTIMRHLLDKQRARLRTLSRPLRRRDGRDGEESGAEEGDENFNEDFFRDLAAPDEIQTERARDELGRTARMLALLDELLVMQDYTLSQMGTFSQG